jgi:hypothetical protein
MSKKLLAVQLIKTQQLYYIMIRASSSGSLEATFYYLVEFNPFCLRQLGKRFFCLPFLRGRPYISPHVSQQPTVESISTHGN